MVDTLIEAMFSVMGLFILLLAFLILVVTFFWIARILGMKSEEKVVAADDEMIVELEELEEDDDEEEQKVEEPPKGMGKGSGANYGLLIGLLSCLFFWVSPLMLALSLVGMFYSGRAVWGGIKHFRTLIFRALLGLMLSLGSVGLHYWKLVSGFRMPF